MSPPSGIESAGAGDDLDARIVEQGNKVRQLKADKKDKQEVDEAVKLLLDMKVIGYFFF
jgi:bifunctional glutamyl/prolyl-tRNA synthetase